MCSSDLSVWGAVWSLPCTSDTAGDKIPKALDDAKESSLFNIYALGTKENAVADLCFDFVFKSGVAVDAITERLIIGFSGLPTTASDDGTPVYAELKCSWGIFKVPKEE